MDYLTASTMDYFNAADIQAEIVAMDDIKLAKRSRASAAPAALYDLDAYVPEIDMLDEMPADVAEKFPEVPVEHAAACDAYADFAAARLARLMVDCPPIGPADPAYEDFKNEPVHIPLGTYIRRILKLSKAEASVALAAVVYVERMLAAAPALEVSNNNIRRLVFVAMMVASKMVTDIPYTNKYWAAISGTFSLRDLNRMEADMLTLLAWNVSVSRDDFDELHAAALCML